MERSRILSDLESLIMDISTGEEGFPSPFSAGMFDKWKFDLPSALDDESVSMSEEELQKVLPIVRDEHLELDCSGLEVKDEFGDYDFEPYTEVTHSGGGGYNEGNRVSSKQRIERACVELAISMDANDWTVEDVEKWCIWVCQTCNVSLNTLRLEQMRMNGRMLCSLSKAQLEARLPQAAETLYAELQIWRNVHCLMSPMLTLDWNRLMTACATALDMNKSTDAYIDFFTTTQNNQPTSISLQQNVTTNSNLTTSTVARPSSLLLPQCVLDASHPSPAAFNYLSGCENHILSEIPVHRLAEQSQDSDVFELLTRNFVYSNESSRSVSPYNSSSSSSETTTTDDFTEQRYIAAITPNNGRQSNHLWQFLKELLSQPSVYQNCIRWLDRSKGIFKIEDSSRVAKLWGQRKNRPAMNYDKLSRSIRQYYKKGIIKKTSQSKRLVYQFCPSYA